MNGKTLNSRSAALGLWTALALCTTVVASRRLSGNYTGPLPSGALFVAVMLAGATSLTALWLFRRNLPRTEKSPLDWLPEGIAWGLPTLFAFVIAAGATPGQTGGLLGLAGIGVVLLGVAVLETTAWWKSQFEPVVNRECEVPAEPQSLDNAVTISGSAGASPSLFADEPTVDEHADETTTQWMTRREEPDGEAIEGTIRVHFAPGQREVVVHVTFCPPLLTLPEVELECVDGDDWQIKTEAALPYGLRIQVRRSTAVTLEQTGRIAYLATSTGRSKAA